jgi:hypothetical protein
MTRITERSIWVGLILLLLITGAVLFAGPAGRMLTLCQDMMDDTTRPNGSVETASQASKS